MGGPVVVVEGVEDCRAAGAKEVRGVARTLKRWRSQILAWHSTGASNGPTEGAELDHQEGQAGGRRLPVLHQLPPTNPPRRRRMRLVAARPRTPLKREGPLIGDLACSGGFRRPHRLRRGWLLPPPGECQRLKGATKRG